MRVAAQHADRREGGFTFAELMFAIVVIVAATLVLIQQQAINYRANRQQKDRVFAFMTAKSILDEVQAYTSSTSAEGAADVDDLDDGATPNPTLSIATKNGTLVAPDHEISANYRRSGEWVWFRQISVSPLPGFDNRKLRYVTVRVLKREGSTPRVVASLSSVVNSAARSNATTQVLDVYYIAIENIPGWWVHMESIRPFLEAITDNLERSNPGLEIRRHWITKASYGRNRVYRPYINDGVDSEADVPDVYFMPGTMPAGSASVRYYVPSLIKGRFVSDAGGQNEYDSDTNPYPYALADFFNHTMRLPQERAFHEARIAAIRDRQAILDGPNPLSLPPFDDMSQEPTYRLLLEDMATNPERYEHALMINLHGELLPMPAIRNYSDPAKDPVGLPRVRVVTHPEELRTQSPPAAGDTDVRLRVYAFVDEPAKYTGATRMPDDRPIAIQVMDMDLTDGAGSLYPGVTVENLRGGVTVAGTDQYFPMSAAKAATDPSLDPDEMYYEVSFVDPGPLERKYTLLKLYRTPVIAPAVTDIADPSKVRGLYANRRSRLYGMEYVPSCTEAALDFSRDLYAAGDGPKNTARWVITIPSLLWTDQQWVDTASPPNYFDPTTTSDPDRVLTVRTRIWDPSLADPLESGTWPAGTETRVIQPENLSETYTWWARTRDAVPLTERSQMLGDPRHNPYKDLLNGDPDFPNGYNWFFDGLDNNAENSAPDYPGLDPARLTTRWEGRTRMDVPRFMEKIRTALINSEAVFSSLVGWSFYYMGIGGEIGYDANNGYPNSIPVDLRPFGTPNANGYINLILDGRRFVRGTDATSYWWGIPWLGELCPDDVYATQWLATDANGHVRGNLVAGKNAGEFYQQPDQTVYVSSDRRAYGTIMNPSNHRTASEGCTTFFNIGTSASTFHHQSTSGDGTLVGSGLELRDNYNLIVLDSTPVSRPFGVALSGSGGVGDEWSFDPYASERAFGAILRTYYSYGAGLTGSGLIELTNASGTSSALVIPNGMAESASTGVSVLARYSLLTVVHSFLESMDPVRSTPTEMLPRVKLEHPTEISEIVAPASVDIVYDIDWSRWDGLPYTGSIPSGTTGSDSEIEYVLMYSNDDGQTWRHVLDDTPAIPGERPTDPSLLMVDVAPGQETYSWPTPAASYPMGSYWVRVEVYRRGKTLHYAYHQRKFFLER